MLIKRPGGRHKVFRLLEKVGDRYLTQKPPELEGVNAAYLSGRLTLEQAHRRLKELTTAWQPTHATIAKSRTEQLIEDFWERSPKGAMKARKNTRAAIVARAGYREVAKLLPQIDVQTATVHEVLTALSGLDKAKQRKLISRINTLWAWLGRPTNVKIPLPRLSQRELGDITSFELAEVLAIASCLPTPLDHYCVAAFGCGGRPGEVFALTGSDLKENGTHVWVDKTWDEKYKDQDTKNSKTGLAFVIPECRGALAEWVSLPIEVKQRWWRKSAHAAPFRDIAGADPYSLRHSYARHMLGLGASLTDLRMWMRSDMKTIERYYLKWVQTSAEMRSNLKRFG